MQRREIGIINVGGKGSITAGDKKYDLGKLDALYIGKGTEKISFSSTDKNAPAVFYLLSSPAHRECETRLMKKEETSPVDLGASETANKRTIYKYIHADGIQSCQLVMGLTILAEGSVWNTMPAHTHTRRMEAYFYFDVPAEHRVIHFMGEPKETRHLVMANHEAVVSPPWSIHAGCGTSKYGFIWGMAGENFQNDIYNALVQANDNLSKYHTIQIIFPNDTYHPREILEGFYRYCQEFAFNYKVVHDLHKEPVKSGEVCINLMENDLVFLVEKS